MIFVCEILRKFDIKSLYICPLYLYIVTTLPWEIQKSHFSTFYLFIQTSHYYVNKLQLLYCSLSVYLLLFNASYYLCSPILWSVFYLFVQSFTEPPMATHNRLFSESPIFGNVTYSQM